MTEIVNAIVPAHVQPVFVALYAGLAMLAASFLIAKAIGREADIETKDEPFGLDLGGLL